MAVLYTVHGLRRIPRVPNREEDRLRLGPRRMDLIPRFHRIPGLVHRQPRLMRRLLHMKQHRQTCLRRRVQRQTAQADSLFPYRFLNTLEVQFV